MARTPQYQKLPNELESGKLTEIERKVLEALLKAPNGLTRQGLIRIVFGVEPQHNLTNDPYDRKIRKGIEGLRNRMIPIISSSGEAGYRLDTSPEAVENMIREWESRIAHLQQKFEITRQYYGL